MIAIQYNKIKNYFFPEKVDVAFFQKNILQKIEDVSFPVIKELAVIGISIAVIVSFRAPTSASYNKIKNYFFPEKVDVAFFQKNNLQKIKDVAFSVIKEFAVLGISIAVIVSFGAPTSVPFMLTIAIASTGISLVLKYLESLADPEDSGKELSKTLRALLYSVCQGKYLGTFIHEFGHYISAKKLYEIDKISISLSGNGDGLTRYTYNGLSKLGGYFGKEVSRGIVSASGTLLEISCASLAIISAIKLYKKHPTLAKALLISSFMRILGAISYALSAFTSKLKGHDFISIAKNLQINPVISAIIIVAIPFLTFLIGIICSKSFRNDFREMKKSISEFFQKIFNVDGFSIEDLRRAAPVT